MFSIVIWSHLKVSTPVQMKVADVTIHPVSFLNHKDKHNHAEQELKTNLTLSLTFTLFVVLISEACKTPGCDPAQQYNNMHRVPCTFVLVVHANICFISY